uniref:hypothetical protein n=1 Tax=Vibrio alfacsensis TaxID=1074311 RepID=UPI00100866B8|nr:hypothetical protein [Vibrio alfacsensis]
MSSYQTSYYKQSYYKMASTDYLPLLFTSVVCHVTIYIDGHLAWFLPSLCSAISRKFRAQSHAYSPNDFDLKMSTSHELRML